MREIKTRPPGSWRNLIPILALALLLGACAEQEPTSDAAAKAQELESRLAELSVDLPAESGAVVFGEDGAHLCAAAAADTDQVSQVAFTPNFFALRKIEVDPDDVAIARAVIDVYCPDEGDVFEDYVSGLALEGSDD